MAEARKTPRGARPNRRGEPARLAERARKNTLPCASCSGGSLDPCVTTRKDRPSGRSLDPGREAGARGMIVTAQPARAAPYRIRLTGSSANYSFSIHSQIRYFLRREQFKIFFEHAAQVCCAGKQKVLWRWRVFSRFPGVQRLAFFWQEFSGVCETDASANRRIRG